MQRYAYTKEFMQYAAQSSAYSAMAIASMLRKTINVHSVLDVGCARDTWLQAWKKLGIKDLHGIDGEYVDRQYLELSDLVFTALDLNRPFNLGRQFDLVQSLEVGEHIEESAAEDFVEGLARHARSYILFSAAPPGQGGEYRINEQPYEFWRRKFEQNGFVAIDAVRPAIAGNKRISYWYRYNTLLFVRRELVSSIPNDLHNKVIHSTDQIADISPIGFRIRKAIVRRLPDTVQYQIAKLKSKVFPTGRI